MSARKAPPAPWALDRDEALLWSACGGYLVVLTSIHSALDVVRAVEELYRLGAPALDVVVGTLLAIYPVSALSRPSGRLDEATQLALIERAATAGPPPKRRRAISDGTRHVHRIGVAS